LPLIVLVCREPGLPGPFHTPRAAAGKAFTQP
jgi:hypothetical protein